ncbi:ribonuclease H [Gemmatirosa kalamazoonensis]|uniref:ribonuclease H n=1 Tax=Gemmatirosa kalamazoonensis TaxID=861299 RepID=W0RFM9_9BACT|nr:ribonuclease H [Gemmatirosa kalamazoonensis]AHG89909.1 ribonuclease H [Gemmatirosa kalamazoonensis]
MSGAAHPLVAVYADESCLGNGRAGATPGGAGGLVEWKHPRTGEILRWDYWISEPDTTNNRMALRSVIEAFRGLSRKGNTFSVVFTSDSKYIVDGMTQWVPSWMKRNWTRKTGPIENLELWQEAVAEVEAHQCAWRWVRGHNGHPQNEYANFLATRAAAERTASRGLVPSGFEAWVSTQQAKGALRGVVDPFPPAAVAFGGR